MTPKALWLVVATVLAVGAAVAVRRLARRPEPRQELADLVLAGLGPEWADRFDTDGPALRRALVDNNEPQLLTRIDAEVGVVDIKLTRLREQRTISAVLLCEYPANREQTKVTLDLGWIDTPADVREEFLRTGETEVFRKWTAPAEVVR